MQGKTYKLTNADYRTLIVLQSGECIGTRRDGGPHRFFKDRTAAERYLGETEIEWPDRKSVV